MERKCLREKQRRNEFNQGLERLSEFLYQVEPSLQSGKDEGIEVAESITNRSDLVNVTVRVITRLYQENESLKARIEVKSIDNPPPPSLAPVDYDGIAKQDETNTVSSQSVGFMSHQTGFSSAPNAPAENSALAALLQQQRMQVMQMQQLQAVSANLALTQHPSMLNSLEFASTMPQMTNSNGSFNSPTHNLSFGIMGLTQEYDGSLQDGSNL